MDEPQSTSTTEKVEAQYLSESYCTFMVVLARARAILQHSKDHLKVYRNNIARIDLLEPVQDRLELWTRGHLLLNALTLRGIRLLEPRAVVDHLTVV